MGGHLFGLRTPCVCIIPVFQAVVHPLTNRFPLYCKQELVSGWENQTLLLKKSSYAIFLSVCALSAFHTKKGALFTTELPQMKEPESYAAEYLKEAVDLIPTSIEECKDLDYLR